LHLVHDAMGKKAAGAQPKKEATKEEKPAPAPVKESAPAPSQAAKKGKAAAKAAAQEKPSMLSHIRPAPRSIFFLVFCLFCAGVCFFYDPCAVKGKRRDCGFAGISPGKCRSMACFFKGGGSIGRKTLKVKRKEGSSLGLTLAKGKDGFVVEEVKADGAVHEYNEAHPQDAIVVGTPVVKIDKAEGSSLTKEVDKKKGGTVELEIKRNRVPSFLMFLENPKKPTEIEKFLTSPGTQYFVNTGLFLGKIGAAAWFVSGYPLASLPTYMTISAGVSFYLSRCCHNEQVATGEPHCFKGRRDSMSDVLEEAFNKVKAMAEKVSKDPKGYFTWLFIPNKSAYSFMF